MNDWIKLSQALEAVAEQAKELGAKTIPGEKSSHARFLEGALWIALDHVRSSAFDAIYVINAIKKELSEKAND